MITQLLCSARYSWSWCCSLGVGAESLGVGAERGLRTMRKDIFAIKRDGSGRRYITVVFNEFTKNHQNDPKHDSEEYQLMFEQDSRCPVASFEKYMAKLNPARDDFWQRPSPSFKKTGVWYENKPIGVNTLHTMMREISLAGELSTIYTNHRLRATTITVLSRKGISPNTSVPLLVTDRRRVWAIILVPHLLMIVSIWVRCSTHMVCLRIGHWCWRSLRLNQPFKGLVARALGGLEVRSASCSPCQGCLRLAL